MTTTPAEPTPETAHQRDSAHESETVHEPVAGTEPRAESQPHPQTQPEGRRRIPGGPLTAIIAGSVLAAALLFGGGVALGIALPVGDGGGSHQSAFDGDGGRPELPGRGGETRTNPNAPSTPNQDDTETQDESEAG